MNPSEASLTKLENSFILISLNRFQQIIGVHTLQAFSEQIKVGYLFLENSAGHQQTPYSSQRHVLALIAGNKLFKIENTFISDDLADETAGGSGSVEEHPQSNCLQSKPLIQ